MTSNTKIIQTVLERIRASKEWDEASKKDQKRVIQTLAELVGKWKNDEWIKTLSFESGVGLIHKHTGKKWRYREFRGWENIDGGALRSTDSSINYGFKNGFNDYGLC